MTIIQLQYFNMVAQSGHVSNTALDMNISQSTISMSLMQLEEELGVKLFEKKGRMKQLTPAGVAFQQRVNKILEELELAQNELTILNSEKPIDINLGVDIMDVIIPGEVDFLKRNPKYNLHQQYISTMQLIKKIESKEFDFGITQTPIDNELLQCTTFLTERIGVLVPVDHELAERDSVRLADLAPYSFITLPKGNSYRNMAEEFCQNGKFKMKIRAEAIHMQMLLSMVAEGLGIAFLSDGGWIRNIAPPFEGKKRHDVRPTSFDLRKHVKLIPLVDTICQRSLYIVSLKKRNIPKEKWFFYLFFCDYYQGVEEEQIRYRKTMDWK